ncbi:MAG: primosomal protein N' [Candidatus Marinimicrobia bacterium]|nr:primosomal protein N' [Candidatus Neomarinimicrobiota bacterium]
MDVAFPISNYQVFTYKIPKQFAEVVRVGARVRAPIGKRTVSGIIVKLAKNTSFTGNIKKISEVIDDTPILDESLWQLIQWISSYYITPLGKAATVIPANLSVKYKPQERWAVQAKQQKMPADNLVNSAPAQLNVLNKLIEFEKPIPITEFNKLVASPLTVCKGLEKKGLVKLFKKISTPLVNSFSYEPIHKEISFSDTQVAAIGKIQKYINEKKYSGILLHGVPSSGKTEVYIKIAQDILEYGKSIIILLPEIALTPQIAGRFRAVFGDNVGLWHSKLTGAARAFTWTNICNGKYKVIVGARSAIFVPLKNLGLVVVDEEQETSYKQEAPEPRYHARDVALMRGKFQNAAVVLVSATPSLENYYNHIMGKLDYCYLPDRFNDAAYPTVTVVDMIKEQEETGKIGQIFSSSLQQKIEQRLEKNEQIILLQNRRGYAPIYRCRDCGEMIICPTCSIPLTYHRVGENLQCHFCGHLQTQIPQQCNHCNSGNLVLSGTGTQKVEDIINETFPNAKIVRLDMDTTRSGKVLTETLTKFKDGKIDILLGTQMIAKGLDFDNVTLVGIINADTGLFLPDFRSGERSFQLIYQAAGRSGRRKKRGEVVIQTYNANNPVIRYAARLDLKKYYNIIIGERKELNYPPFTWLAKAEFTGVKKSIVDKTVNTIRNSFQKNFKGLEILGPAWCYREHLRGKYRMQIVFKSSKELDPNGRKLHQYLKNNLLNKKIGSGIKVNIDIDPVSLL